MRTGVIVFPGSNCDLDAYHLVRDILEEPVEYIWYNRERIEGFDLLILPGGFSYGDYLRSGAIARFAPVMGAVEKFARSGGLVLGICNGFQVLTEAGLLPGALYRNSHLQFRCKPTCIRVENNTIPFTCAARREEVLNIPVAHGDGNYYIAPDQLKALEDNRQIVFRYVTADGEKTIKANPSGSVDNIAGVCNRAGNVLGLMPHPERAGEDILGSADGLVIFKSLLKFLGKGEVAAGG